MGCGERKTARKAGCYGQQHAKLDPVIRLPSISITHSLVLSLQNLKLTEEMLIFILV
jgi:hypothetical protein